MQKIISLLVTTILLAAISNNAYGQKGECPTQYIALAKTANVKGNPGGSKTLFEVPDLETGCYKELRVFVHIFNNSYQTSPFVANSKITISAFHGIGKGSWGYFSREFPKKVTSEFGEYIEIPIIGEKTRLVVSGYNMPGVNLEVDVAAYLVR